MGLKALEANKYTNFQSDFLSTNFPRFGDQDLAVRWLRRGGLLRRDHSLRYHFPMVSLTNPLVTVS